MLETLKPFRRLIFLVSAAFAIFQLPKNVQDIPETAKPWWAIWNMVDQNTALWVTLAAFGIWIAITDLTPLWRHIRGPKFSLRHASLLQTLADRLIEAEQAATYRLNALVSLTDRDKIDHYQAFHTAWLKVEMLTKQIAYDDATAETIRDYLQLCAIILDDELNRRPSVESRQELDRLRGPVFQALHSGRSIDRSKLPLPDWMRTRGTKPAMERT